MSYLAQLEGHESTGVIAHRGLARMHAITAALGLPNTRFPAIHITGTNGKGSVAAMTTGLLRTQGLRVGTYTSPHLSSVTERIRIDDMPVAEEHFADGLGRVASAAARLGAEPSWFEALTATGLLLFAEAGVDVAVVEVGMLGRWDATNILDSRVAVVTNVELDHLDYAGPGRIDVAREKAGIVHPGAILVLGNVAPELRSVFAAERPRQLLRLDHDVQARHRVRTNTGSVLDISTPQSHFSAVTVHALGAHQCSNAALAVAAAEAFTEAPLAPASVREALEAVRIAGRAEVIRTADPVVLLDGAHNPAAAAVLARVIDDYFPVTDPRVLIWAMSGARDPQDFLAQLAGSRFDLVVTTQAPSPRAIPAGTLAHVARQWDTTVVAAARISDAVEHAIAAAGPTGLVIATGSLHLLTPVREAVHQRTGPARLTGHCR